MRWRYSPTGIHNDMGLDFLARAKTASEAIFSPPMFNWLRVERRWAIRLELSNSLTRLNLASEKVNSPRTDDD
jgi:hypothetical protein